MRVVIYQQKGLGLWVLAAAWGAVFKVAFLPVYWASECGRWQAMTVARRMEERVGEVELPTARGCRGPLN